MRKLDIDFMTDLKDKRRLSPLLNFVRNDRDLLLEIRENELNIYFKGNNLLKLSKKGSIYHATHSKKFSVDGINKYYIENKDDCDKIVLAIPLIKQNISFNNYKAKEIECEQLFIRFNNNEYLNSEYIIVDRQIAKHKWPGRMDLIALYWPNKARNRNRIVDLALIEMKFRLNPDISVIKKQIESYYDYLKDHFHEIRAEARNLLLQKLDLSLIQGSDRQLKAMRDFKISDNLKRTQIVIVLVDYKPQSKLLDIAKLRKAKCFSQVKIFNVGFCLWDKNKLNLEI